VVSPHTHAIRQVVGDWGMKEQLAKLPKDSIHRSVQARGVQPALSAFRVLADVSRGTLFFSPSTLPCYTPTSRRTIIERYIYIVYHAHHAYFLTPHPVPVVLVFPLLH
jgi:hypothetical protein